MNIEDRVQVIIVLNEKKFIMHFSYQIKQFELKDVKKIIHINTINLKSFIIKKSPKSRLLIKKQKNDSDSSIINFFC